MGQRADRVGHLLQRELSELLRDLKDPRIQVATLVTITNVRVSDDMSMARVLISVVDQEPIRVLRAIGHAQKFIHVQLAQRLQMKKIPELRFYLDGTEDRASHIDDLLREVKADPPVGPSTDPATATGSEPAPASAPAAATASVDDHEAD